MLGFLPVVAAGAGVGSGDADIVICGDDEVAARNWLRPRREGSSWVVHGPRSRPRAKTETGPGQVGPRLPARFLIRGRRHAALRFGERDPRHWLRRESPRYQEVSSYNTSHK